MQYPHIPAKNSLRTKIVGWCMSGGSFQKGHLQQVAQITTFDVGHWQS